MNLKNYNGKDAFVFKNLLRNYDTRISIIASYLRNRISVRWGMISANNNNKIMRILMSWLKSNFAEKNIGTD